VLPAAYGLHRLSGEYNRPCFQQTQNSNANVIHHQPGSFNEKFDFVMVPAGAVLLATVKDRTSMFEKITSLKITVRSFESSRLLLSPSPRSTDGST
jgi:hypothetical protein